MRASNEVGATHERGTRTKRVSSDIYAQVVEW